MQELNACWPIVQQINAAGTRTWKKRNAVRSSSDDARTSARPRSEAFDVVGEGREEVDGVPECKDVAVSAIGDV
jgi:hypothetical protein